MLHLGIIGKPLGHSLSKVYFEKRFTNEHIDADYTLHEIETIEQAIPLLDSLDGMNVTSPYKEAIMPYLSSIDPIAQRIGAVNVVYHKRGYNTDWIGVMECMRPFVNMPDMQALVLGSGGAAKAVRYALQELGVKVHMVSRQKGKAELTYADLTQEVVRSHTIIANCTPLGMAPHEGKAPEVNWITNHHVLFDCIYNPPESKFLKAGSEKGALIINGLGMFLTQAEEAWKIFNELV